MHTRTFTYTPIKVGQPMLVTIDRDDEFYHVTIGDTYLGEMEEDEHAEHGWKTDDPLLLAELPDLSIALKEERAMSNFPFALQDLFGKNIQDWDWVDDVNLNIIAHPDVDIKEFADVLRDQMYDVVLFDKNLFIHLGKEGSSETEEIHVNC